MRFRALVAVASFNAGSLWPAVVPVGIEFGAKVENQGSLNREAPLSVGTGKVFAAIKALVEVRTDPAMQVRRLPNVEKAVAAIEKVDRRDLLALDGGESLSTALHAPNDLANPQLNPRPIPFATVPRPPF